MYAQQHVTALIVAAGSASRMGFDKLMANVGGAPVLWHAVQALAHHPYIDDLVVVAGENLPEAQTLLAGKVGKPCVVVPGGSSRMESVVMGLAACGSEGLIAIHDGARPFVGQDVITRVVEAGAAFGAAAPMVPVKDTIKMQQGGVVQKTLPRQSLAAMQTPQVFNCTLYVSAVRGITKEEYESITDDCMVMERAGHPVHLVDGDEGNRKITTPEDLKQSMNEEGEGMQLRVGHGYDVHKLVEGRPLIMGGVTIPYEKGLLGHSDADVLLHAVADALLGGAAMGDIGTHFPDNDPAYKGADSMVLLRETARLISKAGYSVQNVDATLLCQAPKLAPHIPAMRQNIAAALGIALGAVGVKATTEEGLGFTGTGQGIAAHCVVLLQG